MNQKFRAKEKILHEFTESEQAALGHDLAEKYSALLANKELAKQSASEFRGIIKDNEDDCNAIKKKIVTGEEEIYVDTFITFNSPTHGYKRCTRADTGEELWKREMTVEELNRETQGDLFPDDQEYVISGGSGTEQDPYTYMAADKYDEQQKQLTAGNGEIQDVPFEEETTESIESDDAKRSRDADSKD